MTTNILDDLKELAVRAFNGTSHTPTLHGQQVMDECMRELEHDLGFVRVSGGDEARYIANYKKHLRAWLAAHSRCMSTWVTGPAKFPIRKAAKANAAEQKRYTEFREWRERAITAIARGGRRAAKTATGDVEDMTRKIAEAEAAQDHMKRVNTILRKYRKSPASAIPVLMDTLQMTEKQAWKVVEPDVMGGIGYAGYCLTNNNANIRRMKDRLVELQRKEAASDQATKSLGFNGGEIELDFQADRLRIHYPGKPDAATITMLKHSGFRWAPSNAAWQRQLTPAALHSATAVAPEIDVKALFDLYRQAGR
ncbi:MAG: hypothetical protein FWD31_12045 [Planctomycetaceae bacterium]|nr:hypothetical protein [Planctomycetaceae bacterium]